MTTQNYLMINKSTNIVDNVCLWDGNPNTWQPPENYLMLVEATTPAMVWALDVSVTPAEWVLSEQIGVGGVGFTWNGSVLTTNEPKPQPPSPAPNQPDTSGTVTI